MGSEQHDSTKREILDRLEFSRRYMSKRYDKWKKAEEQFRAYRPEKEEDSRRRHDRDEEGQPQFTTIRLPYSYAMLLSAHTYWTSVFLSRNPILQLSARHGEPEMSVQGMEALLDYNLQVGGGLPPLYVWMLDVGKYGLGVMGVFWEKEKKTISRIVEVPEVINGVTFPDKLTKKKETAQVTGYVGNRLYNVRPYDFFPDPRVPIAQFQRGEFCCREVHVGWNEVVRRGRAGRYFNMNELAKQVKQFGGGTVDSETGSSQIDLPATKNNEFDVQRGTIRDKSFVQLHEMFIELIPYDWKLGDGRDPEKWVFTLANENLIVGAEPFGHLHDQYPFQCIEFEVDGYSHMTRGMLEVLSPLENVLEWLFNTHIYSIRKNINDTLIYDPSRIVEKDLLTEDPANPGKRIRLKPVAYGQDVRAMISQIPVSDVTQTHLKDTGIIEQMMQRTVGVTDNIMGLVNAGGRKTATEVRSSTTFGINRLKTNAEFFSSTGFAPLTQMMVQNAQQFYDEEMKFRIAGDLLNPMNTMIVRPDMITGFYDFIPVDGTLPIDRFALGTLWKEILLAMPQIPQVAAQFDIGKIFGFMVQQFGIKNLNQFRIQIQPDAMLTRDAQAGNVVPIGGANVPSGRNPGGNRPPQAGPERPAGAPVLPGVGPVA